MDDITDTCDGENKEVAEMAKKMMRKIKRKLRKRALNYRSPCGFLEDELRQCSKEEG